MVASKGLTDRASAQELITCWHAAPRLLGELAEAGPYLEK